jgi:hypothetical protein
MHQLSKCEFIFARALSAFGANLVLGCRDIERGKQVAEEISTKNGNSPIIDVMLLDTSSLFKEMSSEIYVRE